MFFWKFIYRKKPSWIISFSAYLWHLIFVLVIEIVFISSSEKELLRSYEALDSLKMELWDTSLFLVHTRSWFDFEKVFFVLCFLLGQRAVGQWRRPFLFLTTTSTCSRAHFSPVDLLKIVLDHLFSSLAIGNYMSKVNNKNTRTRCDICSKLTIKTPERCQWQVNAGWTTTSHPLHAIRSTLTFICCFTWRLVFLIVAHLIFRLLLVEHLAEC